MDTKTGAIVTQWAAFLLPHELVDGLCEYGIKDVVLQRGGLDPLSLAHLNDVEAKTGETMLGLGLWGDGVPCNWDRTGSLDCVSLNLPGLEGKWANLRLHLDRRITFSQRLLARRRP